MEISNEHQCGLFCTDESKPSPLLEGVIVQAKLNTNRTCQVHLCQSYLNPTEEAVEVIYIFPLDHRSAVCAFEATIDGVVIQGKVLPTEKAEATYQQAKKEGRKTSLLTQKKQEIFQLNVGNLPAGARATIQLTYVSELLHSADASTQQKGMIHFYLPTHVAPRYCPSSCSSPLPWWTHVPASLLELFSNSRSSSALSCDPSPLSIFVNIDSLAPLREITSNSHAISVEKFPSPAGSSAPHQAEVTLKSNSPLDRGGVTFFFLIASISYVCQKLTFFGHLQIFCWTSRSISPINLWPRWRSIPLIPLRLSPRCALCPSSI